jgi:hypothetical protein
VKNRYLIVILFSAFITYTNSLFSQTQNRLSIVFETGITYGDANYGNEFALEYLRNEDYNGLGASNGPDPGFDFNIGVLYDISEKSQLRFSAGNLLFGTEILGNLNDLKSNVTRPLSSEIPIRAEGRINHSFLKFGVDLIYNFNGNSANGISISAGLNYLLHLGTNWNVDVDFEAGNSGVQNDLSSFADTDLNNVFATNLKLGYNFIVKEKYRITPSFGFDLGLNGLTDEGSLNPTYFSLNLRINAIK